LRGGAKTARAAALRYGVPILRRREEKPVRQKKTATEKKVVTQQVKFLSMPVTEQTGLCELQGDGVSVMPQSHDAHKVILSDNSSYICVLCGHNFEGEGVVDIPDPKPELPYGYVRITTGPFKGRVGYYDDDDLEDREWVGIVYFGALDDGFYLIPKRYFVEASKKDASEDVIATQSSFDAFDNRTPEQVVATWQAMQAKKDDAEQP
jgi:hypothetical protein